MLTSEVEGSPRNVLSAHVLVQTRNADSVAVQYRALAESTASRTPAVPVAEESADAPVLGLLPETAYELSAVAFGSCGRVATGAALSFHTGSLPPDLPSFVAGGPDPSPGYVVLAAGGYGLVIDNTGRVVWYHRFDLGSLINFQAQPNGRYLVRAPSPDAFTPWVELDPTGRVTRRLFCSGPVLVRFHDAIALPDGSYWLLCDQTREVDLSPVGPTDALVIGTTVQHLNADGELLFEWSPFDDANLEDLLEADRNGDIFSWTHGNALEFDTGGDLLLSFRNPSEVLKIDSSNGQVIWRLGGRRGEFVFENGSGAPFKRQHGIRSAGAGEILLLDNLGEEGGSRAERYRIEESTRRLRLIGTYAPEPLVTAEVGGSTQSLPGGRVLVSFGSGGRVEEYDADGNVVWRIEGNPGYIFRAQRILSLYQPGTGLPR